MIKKIQVFRDNEVREDYSWALELDCSQRLDFATKLVRDLWCASHGGTFPGMRRDQVRFVSCSH